MVKGASVKEHVKTIMVNASVRQDASLMTTKMTA